jgi:hypothetical protein
MNTFEKARAFVYRNARPLDLARWQFHFEGGSNPVERQRLCFEHAVSQRYGRLAQ